MEQELPHPSSTADAALWIGKILPQLWRFLRRLGCDRGVAEDLAQDAALAALQSGAHRMEESAATSWLHATARNLFRAHLRAKARRPFLTTEVDAWPDECEFDQRSEQLRSALRRCLLQLAPRARRAMEMRYRGGADRQQIGAELGMQVAGVKTLLQRARRQLRTCVEKQLDEE